MSTKDILPDVAYLPVSWDFNEVLEKAIEKKDKGKVFFFDNEGKVAEDSGIALEIIKEKNLGVFLILDTGSKIRVDRIITLFGKIGAAYDEYDAYANACMSCMGGYEE